MSQYDLTSLHDFLLHTPEQGLRKMLVDQKPITDVHFSLLLKIVRNCDAATFAKHFEAKDFPKIKMSPGEIKLKEKFWQDCENCLKGRGLLSPATKSAA
jgi:hypothetical protein